MALLLPQTRGRRGGDRLRSAQAQTSTLKQPLLFKPLLLNLSWFNRAARGIRTFVTLAAMGLGEKREIKRTEKCQRFFVLLEALQ